MKEAEAFAAMFKAYDRRVYYTALGFLRKKEDAADITQEVFLRAWKNIKTLDHSRSIFPWLYRITKNLCINSSKKKSGNEVFLEFPDLTVGVDVVEDTIVAKETQNEVRQAVLELPDKFREIIILKHYNDCSYDEMAEILEIPKGTVMSRLYNARKMLKDKIIAKEEV